MTASEEDAQHLKWLAIAHYVYAGFISFWSLFGVFFMVTGLWVNTLPPAGNNPPPPGFGYVFAAIGLMLTLMFLTVAVATFFAGRNIGRRKNHIFCLIMAGLDCMWFPIGTTLGAFSFVVLLRPTVKALFEDTGSSPPAIPVAGS